MPPDRDGRPRHEAEREDDMDTECEDHVQELTPELSEPEAAPERGAPVEDEAQGDAQAEPLRAYLRSIRYVRVLGWEEQVELARQMEAADADFRRATLALPQTGAEVIAWWRDCRERGRVTAEVVLDV